MLPLRRRVALVDCPGADRAANYFLLIVLLCCALAVPSLFAEQTKKASAPAPGPAIVGQWAAPVYFCPAKPCVVGVNAALMYNGRVLLYYYPPNPEQGSQALVLDPVSGNLTWTSLTILRNIFCSGLTILPNGQVMVTGGVIPTQTQPKVHSEVKNNFGTTSTMLFDPATSSWTVGQDMFYARWYPSTIELSDGTEMELTGSNEIGAQVYAMETYNYDTGGWTALPDSANVPNAVFDPYARVSLMPSGNVLMSVPSQQTYSFNPSTNTWTFVAANNFGDRYFAPHVLLPGQEKVMVAGGSPSKSNGGSTATNTAEIIDMSAATPAWSYTGAMAYARYNSNLVLLADGTVLVVGGGGGGGQYTNPVLPAELYNPSTGLWTTMASQAIQRTYHSTAMLLPDGRVLSTGSDNNETTQLTYEIYSPPYLFKGKRPRIQTAPTSITYGSTFTISTPDAASVTRVALVRPSATTHANNFDQRYVDLTFSMSNGSIKATAPVNGSMAPPGYYMLVIVNSSGVPSVMPFLNLDTSANQEKNQKKAAPEKSKPGDRKPAAIPQAQKTGM
jgi:hypothetical protein